MIVGDGRPRTLLRAADEVIRSCRGGVQNTGCQFNDNDPPRPIGESRGWVGRNGEVMELLYRPCGPIIAVNGRPVGRR